MEKTTAIKKRRARKPQQQITTIKDKQLTNSPGLDRFDDLLNRLRKSTLAQDQHNPFPSIHAPKQRLSKLVSPADQCENQNTNPSSRNTDQPEKPSPLLLPDQISSPRVDPELKTLSARNSKTSRSPLSSPKATPCIVNLCASSTTPPDQPADEPAEAAAPQPLPTAEPPPSRLDWASLVEAARQSDAEEDQLPDLTEWATTDERTSAPDSLCVDPSSHRPVGRTTPPLDVQSRAEISASLGRPVKIRLGGSSIPPQPAPHGEQPAMTTRADPPAGSARGPASPPPNRRALNPISSSSRLLNQKQKQSIARLIIPVPAPSAPLSASTTGAAATAPPSTASSPLPLSAHPPPSSAASSSCSHTTILRNAGPPRPDLDSCSPLPPRKDPVRSIDPSALRRVSNCLSSATFPSPALTHIASSAPPPPPPASTATKPAPHPTPWSSSPSSATSSSKKKPDPNPPLLPAQKNKKPSKKTAKKQKDGPPKSSRITSPPHNVPSPSVNPSPACPAPGTPRTGKASKNLFDKLTGGTLLNHNHTHHNPPPPAAPHLS
ncbi:hypothetical protein PtA15_16A320 [Puccinia triticina]|uniref:Nascent polypeptide-associated complex subunit alpha, muscle-specific form-like n=1 Tax=Puccinia triticina TaxID=208348 RepID=A0ABY7DBT3_9BASI|nr:uncharacterized protein PtA15_16A320 [Puccinia triticina]WAQ92412.1 hypothetical protein PtA15_16A320 [Puccinia triticina]WAR64153.1 hypothetical protein PtB15_16B313 [Puccinia triticina]